MSRGFSTGFGVSSTDAVTCKASAPNVNISAACWLYNTATGIGANQRILGCFGPWLFTIGNLGNDLRFLYVWSNGNQSWVTTSTILPSLMWAHVGFTYSNSSSANVPIIYINGVAQPISSTIPTGSPNTGSTNFIVGGNGTSIIGMIAHAAYWNSAMLTGAEMAALANGVCPLAIRPEALTNYLPLSGVNSPESDLINGNSVSITGTQLGISDPPAKSVSQYYQSLIDQQLLAFLAARASGANNVYYGPATP